MMRGISEAQIPGEATDDLIRHVALDDLARLSRAIGRPLPRELPADLVELCQLREELLARARRETRCPDYHYGWPEGTCDHGTSIDEDVCETCKRSTPDYITVFM